MPDWFYPLMLLVILAGYVFLFLQGRRVQESVADLQRRLGETEKRDHVPGAPEVVEQPVDLVGPRIDELQRLVAGQATAIDRLAEAVERVEMRLDATPGAGTGGPEETAKTFLLAEGFSSIRVLGHSETPEGVRIRISSLRGDEVRHGHVVVKDGRVVDAALEVPTALFP